MESSNHPPRKLSFLPFLVLLLIGCITYAPLIPQLGFYRDDWYQLWALDTLGPASIITMFSIDRPAMGYLYAATSALFGFNPLAWHLYSLSLRLIGGLIFLSILRRLWPGKDWLTFSASLLSLIYPGFLQQPNANTFSNHLFTYTMALLSIWLTVIAMQSPNKKRKIMFTVFAVLTALLYFPIYEYMIGLEGLRLGTLWLLINRRDTLSKKQKIRSLFAEWLPYAVAMLGFLTWRFFFFKSERVATSIDAQIGQFWKRPKRTLARWAFESLKDPIEAILLGWFVPVYNLLGSANYLGLIKGSIWVALAITLTAFPLVTVYRSRTKDNDENIWEHSQPYDALWLGLFATISAILPVVAFGRDIRWDSGFDRYTLQATAGIGLVVACFLWCFVKSSARNGLLILLVTLSVLTHYLNAVAWRNAWTNQKTFWWQMIWRAPQLKAGTVLLIEVADSNFFEDYEIWGPANLIYGKREKTPRVFAEVLDNNTLEYVRLGSRVWHARRVVILFQKDYNHTLVAAMPTTASCVHLLDGSSLELPLGAHPRIQIVAKYSTIEQIQAWENQATIPLEIFGPEPEHGWCYYYQKAALARQQRNWQEIVRLGNIVLSQGLKPQDKTEWMPFLMGYVVVGDQETATYIADIIRSEEIVRHRLCDETNLRIFPTEEAAKNFSDLLCKPK